MDQEVGGSSPPSCTNGDQPLSRIIPAGGKGRDNGGITICRAISADFRVVVRQSPRRWRTGITAQDGAGPHGHSSIQITFDRYGHLFPRGDDSAEPAAAAAGFLPES